jgi:hypothetical protein
MSSGILKTETSTIVQVALFLVFRGNCPGPDKSRSQGQRGAKKPYFRPYFRFDPKLFLKNAKIFLFFFGVPA